MPTTNSSNSGADTLEELLKRQQDMQYAAMAHGLSGQDLPGDFAQEFAALEQMIDAAKANAEADGLRHRLNDMQYAAMAAALSGQEIPDDLKSEYAELERKLEIRDTPHGSGDNACPAEDCSSIVLPRVTGPATDFGAGTMYVPWADGYMLHNPDLGEVIIHNTADNTVKRLKVGADFPGFRN